MLALVVVLAVGLIIVSSIVPTAMDTFYDDTSQQLTQDEDVTYQLGGLLETNATNVDATNDTATIELNRDGTTVSNTVATGTTTEYNLDGYSVNVTVDDTNGTTSPPTTTVTYEYSPDAAWDDQIGSLYFLIPLFVLLGLLITFIVRSLDMS